MICNPNQLHWNERWKTFLGEATTARSVRFSINKYWLRLASWTWLGVTQYRLWLWKHEKKRNKCHVDCTATKRVAWLVIAWPHGFWRVKDITTTFIVSIGMFNQTFCWHHQRKRFLHAVFISGTIYSRIRCTCLVPLPRQTKTSAPWKIYREGYLD